MPFWSQNPQSSLMPYITIEGFVPPHLSFPAFSTLTTSLKKGPDPKHRLSIPSADAACPAEFLQYFAFGSRFQHLPLYASRIAMFTANFPQTAIWKCPGELSYFSDSLRETWTRTPPASLYYSAMGSITSPEMVSKLTVCMLAHCTVIISLTCVQEFSA